jgi:hypothetical protein
MMPGSADKRGKRMSCLERVGSRGFDHHQAVYAIDLDSACVSTA